MGNERRLIMPGPKMSVTTVDRIASVDGMITDMNAILKDQIEKQRIKGAGAVFTIQEVKVLEGLTDALVKLSREERERLKNEDFQKALENLSDDELLKLIKK